MYGGDYITSAISAAMPGDTIKLGDGIYELDAYIDLSKKITLTSATSAAYTTIRPVKDPSTSYFGHSDLALVVKVSGTSANPVVIDGLTFTRLRSGEEFEIAIYNDGYNYVTVQNCAFNYIKPQMATNYEWAGVVTYLRSHEGASTSSSDDLTSGTITNNTFTNCCTFSFDDHGQQDAVIYVIDKAESVGEKTISGLTISNNIITDCDGHGIFITGEAEADEITVSVTDNTITNTLLPLYIRGYTTGCSILRNTITGGYISGIWVGDTTGSRTCDHDKLVIKNNTITGIAGAGCSLAAYQVSTAILLWDDGTGTVDSPTSDDTVNTVQYNDIYNNDATYSIYVKTGIAAQDCQYNYFGDATGPYYSAVSGATIAKSNPNGTGKQITDLVTYYPWLHKPLADVVADNVSYQTCTMKLVLGGWNTLSTPVQLIAAADAIDELISADDMSIGYYYDAGWQLITTGYVLSPCDAVYVKMKSTASTAYLQFKFDAGAYTTPSKDLAAGWNLISLASLETSKLVKNTMACVDLTAAYLPGWSQVVSPSINATQRDIYYAVETAWSESAGEDGSNTLQPGLGYWCYMQNAATLAGFEITPIVPDLD